MEVTFESVIAHPPEKVWALLADFTNLQWLPGPSKVTDGLHDGYPARVLHFDEDSGVDPIVEYLLSVDPELLPTLFSRHFFRRQNVFKIVTRIALFVF